MKPFTAVPNTLIEALPDLGHDAFILYCYLQYRANGDGEAWPSYETINHETKIRRSNIPGALKKLEELGLIKKRRRFSGSTIYSISTDMVLMGATLVPEWDCISTNGGTTLVPMVVHKQESLNKNHLTRDSSSTDPVLMDKEDPFTEMQWRCETRLGLAMTGERDINAVREMVKEQITDDDFTAALNWHSENGKIIRTIAGALASLKVSKAKRIQAANTRKTKIKSGQELAHDPIGL